MYFEFVFFFLCFFFHDYLIHYIEEVYLFFPLFLYLQALLAEGRFYSDLELTEKEIERMVVEISRAEYLADDTFKQQLGCSQSSTSNAEPSSSGASKHSFYSIQFESRDDPMTLCLFSVIHDIFLRHHSRFRVETLLSSNAYSYFSSCEFEETVFADTGVGSSSDDIFN